MERDNRIHAMARAYADAHSARAAHRTPPPERLPDTLDEAYAVQQRLVELWRDGERGALGGFKIALTSAAMQQMVGLDHPCAGAIFDRDIHRMPMQLSLRDYQHVGLEFELCFRLSHPLPDIGTAHDIASVSEAVGEALPAFEMIDDRHADYAQLDVRDLVGDNAWCAGIVLGESAGDWRELDLSRTSVELEVNGDIERGDTGAALGNPLAALAWVANHQVAQGQPLQAGHVVMTGSMLRTRFPQVGDRVRFEVHGLGSVSLSVAA